MAVRKKNAEAAAGDNIKLGNEKETAGGAGKAAVKKTLAGTKTKRTATKKETAAETAAAAAKKSAAKRAGKKDGAAKSSAKKNPAGNSAKTRQLSQYGGKTLVIVESPAKAKTLEKILGPKYRVLASIGHVRDLPKGRMAIDTENGFEPEYIQVRGKADLIKTLQAASSASAATLLASDPDREGEAIAWHLATLLDIDTAEKCRVRMHEITSRGVKSAISEPDVINMNLVEAQQARRVLDRLVGYELSPLLWHKVQRGLSAGRVQSVALRLICERQEEIERFIPEEYWLIDVAASSADSRRRYKLRVEKYNGKAVKIKNAEEAARAEAAIRGGKLTVDEYVTKESKKQPNPPFKTSTLQQEASRRCGFAPRRTMRVAQTLYEGVEIPGRGPTGLITYMRTDSPRLAPEAVAASRAFIREHFGENYLPSSPNVETAKGIAQDAHEAIRATDASLTPESVRPYLTEEQYKLYKLIWGRFIASQMKDAVIARTSLACSSAGYQMRQAGVAVTFDGWGRVYPLDIKEAAVEPAVKGETLGIDGITKERKFTQPPAQYTEAGLVKALEENGIGRPSTYATIIERLFERRYVDRGEEGKRLDPTELGRRVNNFLVKYFPALINVDFTAGMEKNLDSVESGDTEWKSLVAGFWKDFKPAVDDVSAHGESARPAPEPTGEKCPECGRDLVVRHGRFGKFIGCSGYPECSYTRNIAETTGVKCPKCGQGELVRRKSTKGKAAGRFFYGCDRYPECDYVTWKKPVNEEAARGAEEAGEDVQDM